MSGRRIQNAVFTLTRDCNENYKQISFFRLLGLPLEFVSENVDDKPKLQMTKTAVRFSYAGEMAASQMRVKMSNSNNKNNQRITVPTIQKQRVV